MRKSRIVVLTAVLAVAFAAPAMAEISFFGTARVLPTYYSNFDFDDNTPDAPTLNEGGFTMGEHVRSELRLGWKAGGDNWKIMMIAETDLINEKDTADRSFYSSGTKGSPAAANAGGEFGIERFEASYTFTPAFVLSTGWNIRAADIKTGGLLFGDDHPFIEIGGKLTENLGYALTYLQIQNRQTTVGASPVRDDWRAYLLKFDAGVGSGDAKFTLSPMVLYSDNRSNNAEVFYYGIEGTGQIGIIKPSFEFVYADGEFRNTDRDIQSYAGFAGVEVALSKALNPYVAFRYALGDDNGADNDVEGFVGITDIGRFTPLMGMDGNILGETLPTGGPYGATLYSYGPERTGPAGNIYGGISNLGRGDNPGHMIVAFGSKGSLSDAFSYKAQAFLIWFETTENLVNLQNPGTEVDDYAGTTVDLQLTYKFSPNFSTYIIGSTFIPGDGIKDQLAQGSDDTPAYLASLGLVWTY